MGDQSKHVKQTKAPNRGAENVVTIIRFQQEQQQQLTASLRHLRDYTQVVPFYACASLHMIRPML